MKSQSLIIALLALVSGTAGAQAAVSREAIEAWDVEAAGISGDSGYAIPSDSWERMFKDKSLFFVQPHFAMPLGPKGVFNACISGNQFKSVSQVRVCADLRGRWVEGRGEAESGHYDYHCERWENRDIVIERTQKEVYCEVYNPQYGGEGSSEFCLKFGLRDVTYGATHTLEVVRDNQKPYRSTLVYKEYEIPVCHQ